MRSRPASARTSVLVVAPQASERLVLRLRRALAVVARDLGDDLDLAVGEAGQVLAVADHVVRVQVVLRVRDEEPDVREQRRRFEVLARPVVETVHRGGRVEELEREASDLPRVVGTLVALLHEVQHARAREVAEVVQRAAA